MRQQQRLEGAPWYCGGCGGYVSDPRIHACRDGDDLQPPPPENDPKGEDGARSVVSRIKQGGIVLVTGLTIGFLLLVLVCAVLAGRDAYAERTRRMCRAYLQRALDRLDDETP